MEFIIFFLVNLIRIYKYALLARILLSWMPGSQRHPIARVIYDITEPLLMHVRRVLPRMGMIDLSVLITYFGLSFLQSTLASELGNLL